MICEDQQNILQQICARLISSMPWRIRDVIEDGGKHAEYNKTMRWYLTNEGCPAFCCSWFLNIELLLQLNQSNVSVLTLTQS